MELNKTRILMIIVVLGSIALSAYYYNEIPGEKIASHWNARGEVDDYMDKFWGLFLIPGLNVLLLAFFLLIPRIDPLKANIKKFGDYYEGFIVIFLVFMVYVQSLLIVWNMGFMFNLPLALMPAFALLFYYLGVLMKKTKKNWFIGIRTPWTLSSDKIWEKTHALGSKLFKALAVYSVLLMFFEGVLKTRFLLAFIVPVVGVALFLVVYSYWLYAKN